MKLENTIDDNETAKPLLVSQMLGNQKVLPVVVIENESQALGLVQALLDGGINVIEITLRNSYGIKAIELIKQKFPEMLVLAGTVNSPAQMVAVIKAGVDAIISPGITESLLKTALPHPKLCWRWSMAFANVSCFLLRSSAAPARSRRLTAHLEICVFALPGELMRKIIKSSWLCQTSCVWVGVGLLQVS